MVGGVAFLGPDFSDDLEVGDFLPALNRDFVVLDGEEGGGAFYALAIVGTNADAFRGDRACLSRRCSKWQREVGGCIVGAIQGSCP